MLSLPITILQVAMFGWASAAASSPGTWVATAAEIFPLSSPFAMAAHAANSPDLWPHALALAWQLLWVSIVIWLSAGWFRRGLLQSGGGKRGWRALFRRGGWHTLFAMVAGGDVLRFPQEEQDGDPGAGRTD